MPAIRGEFVWYDVMTTDVEAAKTFYRKVMGWQAKDSGLADRSYTILSMGDVSVGGLMALPDDARARGVPPCWTGYVGVDDVDAFTSRVRAAGGTIAHPPQDIPSVGRFSVVADPQGAVFILFQGAGKPPDAPDTSSAAGHVGWHELHAADGAKAFDFYADLFGWTKADAMDMGAMGIYQLFATGGAPVGGMMTKTPEMPQPCWLYYFNVEGIDAAIARVKEGGGTLVNGPLEVPGGSFIAQCLDPQRAMFAMVAPKR
jgi:hypothetical protein